MPIYIATDDCRTVSEFRSVVGSKADVVSLSEKKCGHDQRSFNAASRESRREETIFLLFELEILRTAHSFVGAAPSNVYYWLRYLRGNTAVGNVGRA